MAQGEGLDIALEKEKSVSKTRKSYSYCHTYSGKLELLLTKFHFFDMS